MTPEPKTRVEHTVAIVVSVYRGEQTLPALVDELDAYVEPQVSPGEARFRAAEVVLVHDAGPDSSDLVIRELAHRHAYVGPVWLARNYGQHAATLAGMSSTSADWIVTMDEDGQHDPGAIGDMLDTALSTRSPLGGFSHFHSFRLGEAGRGLAAYCGEGVYLDVALAWVVNRTAAWPVGSDDLVVSVEPKEAPAREADSLELAPAVRNILVECQTSLDPPRVSP
jgi:polyisoprenyl-phosphate glycosyltransferase